MKLESQNVFLIDCLGIVNDIARKPKEAQGRPAYKSRKRLNEYLARIQVLRKLLPLQTFKMAATYKLVTITVLRN